jgi:hypothetical protein
MCSYKNACTSLEHHHFTFSHYCVRPSLFLDEYTRVLSTSGLRLSEGTIDGSLPSSIGVVRGKSLPGTAKPHACFFRHALALDERRFKSLPEYACGGATLTNEGPTHQQLEMNQLDVSVPYSNPHVKEVWFSGDHSDMLVNLCCFRSGINTICRGSGSKENIKLNRQHPAFLWLSFEAEYGGLKLVGTPSRAWPRNTKDEISKSPRKLRWKIMEYVPVKRLTYKSSDAVTRRFVHLSNNLNWINHAK